MSTSHTALRWVREPSVKLALLSMLLSTLLLASMHTLVRELGTQMHPFVIVFFRNLFGLLVLMPLLIKGGPALLRTQNVRLHALRAAVGIGAMLCWFYALSQVPIANATALSFSVTLFASLSAWLFLGERLRIRRWLAIVAGFVGVFIVLRPATSGFDVNALYVLASSVAWGCSVTIVKILTRTESVTSIVAWMGISLTILSLPPALFYWQMPVGQQWVMLLSIGALATGGHMLMTRALQIAETSTVMTIDFTRLVWTALFGVIWFGEVVDVWTLTGASIIFGAGWYIVFRESRVHGEVSAVSRVDPPTV